MSQPGDALQHTTSLSGSKADEYYAWKLMQERLAVWGDDRLSDSSKKLLGSISQREGIKHKILSKILGDDYAESTAKYAQLVRYTEGRKNKLDQAEYLANKVFDTLEAKAVLNELVGNPDGAEFTEVMGEPNKAITGGVGLGGILGNIFGAVSGGGRAAGAASGGGGGGGG
jgi:hypothetical protein